MQSYLKLSVSNILIIVCGIVTFFALVLDPNLYQYAMNNNNLSTWDYNLFFVQIFISQFLHGSVIHLASNVLFLYFFGNLVENILQEKKYIFFFLFSSVIIALWLTQFWNENTVGISGFAMALLSYYTVYLYQKKSPEYKWGITAIIINVWIGLSPWISLLWHLIWAVDRKSVV